MATDRPRVRIVSNPRRLRAMVRGVPLIDTTASRFVWEVPYYPAWYFPVEAVAAELVPNGNTLRSTSRGDGTRYDVIVGDRTLPDAAWCHLDSPVEELRSLVRFEWGAVDAWFEEDVEVFVHPRSPEVRVDALPSSRHVRVLVGGEVIADSVRPTILYETGLPPRYYFPKTDVRMDLLTPTSTSSACPYKGWANYWKVEVGAARHEDIAWGYRTPLPESEGIAGLVCFYNEKVDLEVDGEAVERPMTKFS